MSVFLDLCNTCTCLLRSVVDFQLLHDMKSAITLSQQVTYQPCRTSVGISCSHICRADPGIFVREGAAHVFFVIIVIFFCRLLLILESCRTSWRGGGGAYPYTPPLDLPLICDANIKINIRRHNKDWFVDRSFDCWVYCIPTKIKGGRRKLNSRTCFGAFFSRFLCKHLRSLA